MMAHLYISQMLKLQGEDKKKLPHSKFMLEGWYVSCDIFVCGADMGCNSDLPKIHFTCTKLR